MAAVLNEAVVFKQKLIGHRNMKISVCISVRGTRAQRGVGMSARLCERNPIFRYER